jgi:hypothetical protein
LFHAISGEEFAALMKAVTGIHRQSFGLGPTVSSSSVASVGPFQRLVEGWTACIQYCSQVVEEDDADADSLPTVDVAANGVTADDV